MDLNEFDYWSYGRPRRYACDVLEEMRTCDKTKNYACLLSLIEELQIIFNRMESALENKRDYYTLKKKLLSIMKHSEKTGLSKRLVEVIKDHEDFLEESEDEV